MAHICGEKKGASRHNALQTSEQRDDYANLILLCPNHHTEIDKKENESVYSVVILDRMKADHEKNVDGRLEYANFTDKVDLVCRIKPLLAENHSIFLRFGPQSEIARKHPESDAHQTWLTERFSTIIPNNRRIAEFLKANQDLFNLKEQSKIADFLLHVHSYERWVNDEINYEGVVRFPMQFHAMIQEMAGV